MESRLKPRLSQNLMTFGTWFRAVNLRVAAKLALNQTELNFVIQLFLIVRSLRFFEHSLTMPGQVGFMLWLKPDAEIFSQPQNLNSGIRKCSIRDNMPAG